MILKMVWLLLSVAALYAASEEEAKVTAKFEVGIYVPSISGTITNGVSPSNFQDDFGYKNSASSYLAMELLLNYDYAPNLYVGYFNMQERQDTTLTSSVRVAEGDFNGSVSSSVDYEVLNVVFYQDFKTKGGFFSILGKAFYSGDIEFDVGINAKLLSWRFQATNSASSWIHAYEFIPLPYLGAKYYLYDFIAYANVSALAVNRATSATYQAGLEYRVVKGLYFSASYLREEFTVVELKDTVDFTTSGYRFGVKYAF